MYKYVLKTILISVMSLFLLCRFSVSVSAAKGVSVDIPVEIEGGGTAIITSEVNCPLPKTSSIDVENGMTEHINIPFDQPGTYSYTIKTDQVDGIYYAPDYYTAKIMVAVNEDGSLYTVTVLTKDKSDLKPDVCKFTSSTKEKTTEKEPATTSSGEQRKDPPTSRPKTGDDGMLDIYLLICIFASAGLFALSVSYTVSTNRIIKSRCD